MCSTLASARDLTFTFPYHEMRILDDEIQPSGEAFESAGNELIIKITILSRQRVHKRFGPCRYADCPHCYWTGYFASRVGLKGYTRALSGYLQAARQLEFLVGRSATGPNTDELEEAMAIVQHHDGVSGTEKQHVADDYAKRLAIGAAEVRERSPRSSFYQQRKRFAGRHYQAGTFLRCVFVILMKARLAEFHEKQGDRQIRLVLFLNLLWLPSSSL